MYAAERLHDVRIAVKKLRYSMEIGAEARSHQQWGRDITGLKEAQDLLGRLHDLEVLIERARQEQMSLSPPTLAAWQEFDSLIRELEEECRGLHARYLHGRDKLIALTDRVGHIRELSVSPWRRAAGDV